MAQTRQSDPVGDSANQEGSKLSTFTAHVAQSLNGHTPPHTTQPVTAAAAGNDLYQRILAEVPIACLLYAASGECLFANAAAAAILSDRESTLLKRNFNDSAAWREHGLFAEMQKVIATGKPSTSECNYVGTLGKDLWLAVHISPLCVMDGTHYLVTLSDVTAQKIANLELSMVQAHQDEMITARTIDLQTTNLVLRAEVAERRRAEEKLQHQAMLLQNVSDAIVATDLQFRITEWNHAAEAIYGWRAVEVIGRVFDDVVKTTYLGSDSQQVLQEFLETGYWRGEVLQHCRDGRAIRILASVNLLRDQHGSAIGAVAVNRDITASRQAEDQLLTLSSAVEQSPVCVVITDTNGAIEYVNPKFTQLTGYTLAEIKGQNPRILKSGETSPAEYQRLWHTIKAGGQWEGELHNRAKDGHLFWEYARISPIVNRHGEITHFIAVKEDITARKEQGRVQDALLKLAMALRAANGRDEMLPAILKMSAQLVGAQVASYTAVDAATGSLKVEAILRDDEVDYGLDLPLQFDTASCASLLQRGEPMVIDDVTAVPNLPMVEFVEDERAMACLPLMAHGETLGVLCVLRRAPFMQGDIRLMMAVTDMAAVALQRAALHDRVVRYSSDLESEVAKRTRELAEANERLQELDKLKSKFVSDVTHELRTPVTNIGLYIKLLERKPEKLTEYIGVLTDQAERLRKLVKDTLDLSRLDHQRETLNIAPVDINEIVHAIVTAHAARADEQGLKLNFRPAPHLPAVTGDYDKLTQVITNLVANALNYTPQGEITVTTSYSNASDALQCEVHDTGCGIYAEDLAHLFDRFYRGKRDKMAPVPGTGLGLSIVKEIIEMHGGTINVASQVGVGSTFTVTLPVVRKV